MLNRNFARLRAVRAATFGFFGFLLAAVCASHPANASLALPGLDDRWRVYRSPHFELFSQQPEKDSLDLLHRLELVRALAVRVLPLREREPADATLFVFRHGADLKAYAAAEHATAVGHFQAYPDRDVATASGAEGRQSLRALLQAQSIMHHLRVSGAKAPMWVGMGAAALFITVEPHRDGVKFGQPEGLRLEFLKESKVRFSSARFFEPGVVYNTIDPFAWLFLHYLLLGPAPNSREQVTDYLRALSEGGFFGSPEEVKAKTEQLLGMSYEELDKHVDQYRRYRDFPVKHVSLPECPAPASYEVQPVSRDVMQLRLAELMLRTRRSPEARALLANAAAAPDTNPRVHEVLGMDALRNSETDEALRHWWRAIELGSNNRAVMHNLAGLESRPWLRKFDPDFRLSAAATERLRQLFLRSIERTPGQSRAYELLAWVESAAPKPSVANINRVQERFADLDNQSQALVALAHVRLRLGDPAGATELIGIAEQSDDSAFVRAALQSLRVAIASAER